MWVLRGDGGAICSPRFFFLCVVLSLETCFSIGGNVLSAGQNLRVQDTLISEGSIFELGFFTKGESLNIYFGIWYKNFATQTIVWVANRDKPLASPSSSALKLGEDGNLILIDGSSKIPIWNTNQSSTSSSTEAVLLDDGNFVLRDSFEPSTIYWQSFDHPTDTFLPGAKIGINKLTGTTLRLTSWKNSEDPAPGTFSIELEPNGSPQFFLVWNTSIRYWTSGVWNGKIFSLVPEMRANNIYNYSVVINEGERYFTYTVNDTSMLSRLIIDQSGQMKFLAGFKGTWEWISFWVQPKSLSGVYSFCGAFGLFNQNSTNCECLQGFEAVSTEETQVNDWSKGCGRRTPLQCRTNETRHNNDGFFKILHVTLPESSIAYPVENNKLCESACMQNCSCNAYAYNGSGCSIWVGDLMNVQISYEKSNGQDLYLKLAASELQNAQGNGRKLWVIIAIAVPLTVLVLSFFLWKLYRRKVRDYGKEYSGEDFELPFFSFASVFAATEGFSSDNKLGEGGFGPVYRGKLLRGQEIAVKRLSKRSGQGTEEFRNEMVLIAKLQHRNLVKLLGCCVEQGENILIYEYMPNKSLDFFLFDPNKRELLNWHSRKHIIEGIAQGLLYLHQYSRLRIIHRDLKASNILLDKEMNAKISDFGTARMFGGNESQANTKRIVGTYGYMAPEYAMGGLFSIKSDVFSFGVLLLEIVSGKKNSGFYQSNTLNLLVHAWDLWNADKGLDLLDPVISYPSSSLSLRFINIGLLCVQEHSNDRPTMFEVVSMLSSENVPLPTPKTPAFSARRAVTDTNLPPGSHGICSSNDQTISAVEAR